MTHDAKPLSPRHERFVAEFLKDGNATRAYLRAGYSPRGAQPSASRLLRDPRIEAALAAARQHIAEALQVSVERVTQEYAKIAFASVADFVSTDDDGRLRIDLEKANQAQRAGLLELRVSNHSKQEQTVTLKLGKLQALAALSKQLGGLAAKPKPVSAIDGLAEDLHNGRLRYEAKERAQRAEWELAEIRSAQAAPPPQDAEEPPPVAPPTAETPEDEPSPLPVPDDRPREDLSVVPLEKLIWSNPWHQPGMSSADALRRWSEATPSRPRLSDPTDSDESPFMASEYDLFADA